jgi:quercetin dioxygenase-like cupin family protein
VAEHDDGLPTDGLEALALSLPAPRPGPALRDRLLARVRGQDRYLPFLERVMALVDLAEDETHEHLRSIDGVGDWPELAPGVRWRDFEGGPGIGEAHAGIIHLDEGATFPRHAHIGEERVLVLHGRLKDDRGRIHRAGDLIVSPDGSAHELQALGSDASFVAVVIGLDFGA